MPNDPMNVRLAALSEHERYVVQAQLARAEAIADGFAWAASKLAAAWNGVASAAKAWNDERTRVWPHRQALR